MIVYYGLVVTLVFFGFMFGYIIRAKLVPGPDVKDNGLRRRITDRPVWIGVDMASGPDESVCCTNKSGTLSEFNCVFLDQKKER